MNYVIKYRLTKNGVSHYAPSRGDTPQNASNNFIVFCRDAIIESAYVECARIEDEIKKIAQCKVAK